MKMRTVIPAILGLMPVAGLLQAQQPVQTAPQVHAQTVEHPFLDAGFYPAWSKMNSRTAVVDIQLAAQRCARRYEAICCVPPGEETYENVFEALEYADRDFLNATAYWNNLTMVRQDNGTREAQQVIIPLMAGFKSSVTADERLLEVVKRAAAQPWVQGLSPAKKRYVEETLERFLESESLSPEEELERRQMITEHVQLQRLFDKNVINSPSLWFREVTGEDLEGMPEQWVRRVAAQGLRNGRMVLTLGMAYDILKYCTVESTRKLCWEGLNTIGNCPDFDNEPVIARIMELRQKLARISGYKDFADKACHNRMVDTGEKALAFVDDLMLKLQPAYRRENEELLEYIRTCTGEKPAAINPWDYGYYRERLAQARSQFDPESARPYLRSDNVLKGAFYVASTLYGITITEEESVFLRPGETCPEGKVEVWHPSVKVYKVTDNQTGQHLGSFYYDPYPRFGKQWGAWTQAMRPGRSGKNGQPHEPHLVVFSTNFNPMPRRGYALLSPQEAEQLFHEFGHVMHNMLSDTELHLHAGTSVVLDFAELPSQLFQNWAWEPEVISRFAFHHETGEPMPAEMVQKVVTQRNFMPATAAMEKLFTAKLDLEMHMHYAEKFAGKQLDAACAELLAPLSVPMTVPAPSAMRSCVHCIARNYGAGFFCYAWSDMLAADAFSRFKKEGILNPETGAALRNSILKQGSDKPALELYREFMGRDPQADALLQLYGVK